MSPTPSFTKWRDMLRMPVPEKGTLTISFAPVLYQNQRFFSRFFLLFPLFWYTEETRLACMCLCVCYLCRSSEGPTPPHHPPLFRRGITSSITSARHERTTFPLFRRDRNLGACAVEKAQNQHVRLRRILTFIDYATVFRPLFRRCRRRTTGRSC